MMELSALAQSKSTGVRLYQITNRNVLGHSGIAITLQPYSMCYWNLSHYELTELAGVLVAR